MLAAAALLVLFAVLVLRAAWVSDDAFITFRVIDNLRHGHGLRWNVAERVQVSTHPLWLLCLVPAAAVTGELVYTSIAAGTVLSLVSASLIAARVAASSAGAILALLSLSLSRASVDYATSGLENPLTHALLAAFCAGWLAPAPGQGLAALAFVAGLAVLTRLDVALILLPALLWELARRRDGRTLAGLAAGAAPVLAWMAFATLYYGFPLPNTAYAKIGTGLGFRAASIQGLHYLGNSLRRDPLTLATVVFALVLAARSREARCATLALGAAVYLGYVVAVGGDFMSGRFLTAPLVVAAALVARLAPAGRAALVSVCALLALGLAPRAVDASRGAPRPDRFDHGIADERRFWGRPCSLWGGAGATTDLATDGRLEQRRGGGVRLAGAVGMLGYFAGPTLHVIDFHGITDPLLARLPRDASHGFRPGHFRRRVPAGYPERVAGTGHILDRNVAAYEEKLRLLTRGELLSRERLAAIWRFNRGAYDALLEAYGEPPRLRVAATDLARAPRPGVRWNDPSVLAIAAPGIEVDLGGATHAPRVELSLDGNDAYRIDFVAGGRTLGTVPWDVAGPDGTGMVLRTLDVPDAARSAGYDRIDVVPTAGGPTFAIGHVRLP